MSFIQNFENYFLSCIINLTALNSPINTIIHNCMIQHSKSKFYSLQLGVLLCFKENTDGGAPLIYNSIFGIPCTFYFAEKNVLMRKNVPWCEPKLLHTLHLLNPSQASAKPPLQTLMQQVMKYDTAAPLQEEVSEKSTRCSDWLVGLSNAKSLTVTEYNFSPYSGTFFVSQLH